VSDWDEGHLPHQRSGEWRSIVDVRSWLDDWKRDTMISKGHPGRERLLGFRAPYEVFFKTRTSLTVALAN